MKKTLGVVSALRDMVMRAGITEVYDTAPSALECACPIVVCDAGYERTELFDDCEYGRVCVDVIVVRETSAEGYAVSVACAAALARGEWERYSSDALGIRGLDVAGIPERMSDDASGRARFRVRVVVQVSVAH